MIEVYLRQKFSPLMVFSEESPTTLYGSLKLVKFVS